MRRKVSALLGVVLAMLLSVTLAIPASAADPLPGKPMPTDPRFKYGLDYFYKELFDPNNPQGWKNLNVSETVNPSKTGGSWYLNNVRKTRERPSGTANKPLTGKIIMPGQTVVKPPSVYKPTAPFAAGGALGLGRLLGGTGFGIGGKVEAPSNWQEIAQTKVGAGCDVYNMRGSSCTSADYSQILSVSNCAHTATCKSLGGKDASGAPILSDTDWFKDTALPFLADLWAKITGQADSDEIMSSGHNNLATKGCVLRADFEKTGWSRGNVSISIVSSLPRPTNSTQGVYYDQDCAYAVPSSVPPFAFFYATCLDIYGRTADGGGTAYGRSTTLSFGGGQYWDNTGKAQLELCTANTQLLSIQFRNGWTQAQYDAQGATHYSVMEFSEWINPDTNLDSTDNTKATTTVDCKVPTGETYTYSKTVEKTAAFVAPACPEGSDLVRHDVSTAGAQKSMALDSGAEAPGASTTYPECSAGTAGCALSVHIDGQACTTSRQDCRTWPAVAAQSPSRVECKWGTYKMPVSDCYAIAEGYKTETGLVFDPKSGVWTGVDNLGDPIAPAPAPWNPTNPAPAPGVNPGTAPTTGTAPGGSTFPTTGTNPDDGCSAPQWSWNPVEFVKNPVVCALKDAFIPKTDIQARSTELATLAAGTVPISWISQPMIGPSGGGCPNWTINVAGLSENVVCESSFTDAIRGARGPMFGIVASAMIWPLIRSIWYALIPIVRVSPSGSK